ncbi:hypothetical protein AWC22_20640 [Mycobacterium riyadhense]|uniref:CobQ/CobB/MinD/ParA nucleotide binding domain-containing protein n=1 Tax=Mycobacterium riyadhense TaxID=486698 RepID=A0A1X2CPG7_9MYCO|nr:MinD/ParA family protein [Mycobacterium riyadhense]ORW77741.1 hypothetical protein AWC22_20640 [Mycobacterium riyadhense]
MDVATVPRRVQQPGNPGYQRPLESGRAPAPTAPAQRPPVRRARSRSPVAREDRWALDLDARETSDSGRFNWRGLLHRFFRVAVRPGRGEIYLRWLRDRAGRPVGCAFPVAVLNLKGGVGKTTIVEALGSTFADVRNGGVIAVDLDSGDLAERHGRRHRVNMIDILADGSITRYLDERAHAYKNGSGLDVLGLPDYAPSEWRIEHDDFVKAFSALKKHYSVVLVDCVKSMKSTVMKAVLLESRALVIVSDASVDALKKTRVTLNWLRDNGYQRLLESTVLVVNHTDRRRTNASVSTELGQLVGRVACVVMLPFDRHLRDGTQVTLEQMSRKSRLRYLELAAVLGDMSSGAALQRDHPAEIGANPLSV